MSSENQIKPFWVFEQTGCLSIEKTFDTLKEAQDYVAEKISKRQNYYSESPHTVCEKNNNRNRD